MINEILQIMHLPDMQWRLIEYVVQQLNKNVVPPKQRGVFNRKVFYTGLVLNENLN